MNLNTVFGTKIGQTQGFLENGKRIPLSCIRIGQNTVTQLKTTEHDGYEAVQIAFGTKNKISKSTVGHTKKAGVQKNPRFFREIRVEGDAGIALGADVVINEVLKPGDLISVTGTSKGKGYAGVVKRYNFSGGPRTHGQSDRERAPGSIGQSTTPGRVYKGKRMAGRMGNEQVTIHNLVVVDIDGDTVIIKGLVPGGIGSVIKIVKKGEAKNFVPLYKGEKSAAEEATENIEETEGKVEDSKEAEEVADTKEEANNKSQHADEKSPEEAETPTEEATGEASGSPSENTEASEETPASTEEAEKDKE